MAGIKRHLMLWGTGKPGAEHSATGASTVVLENPDHLSTLLGSDLVGPDSVVFVPGHTEGTDAPDGPVVTGYEGSLSEPGAECSLGTDFYLQIQNYGISAYMSVVGPTLIRVADDMDLDAYLADADEARRSGVFPDFLTNPVIQLADLPALGAGTAGDGPRRRLYVDQGGALSTAPGGARLGVLGEDRLDRVEARWLLPDGSGAPEQVAERPWLGRYLAAIGAVRDLRARGVVDVRVSGFGGRLGAAATAAAAATGPADTADALLPLLLWSGEHAFVHDPASGRTFGLDPAAAALAEVLLVSGSVAAGSAHADRTGLERVAAYFADAGIVLSTAAGDPAELRDERVGELVTAGR
ncbi:daptide biosynthesis RiPP recognition protein [Streptomyces sp. NPDC059917]|uniref:daptide biosynthesis RiPP recognition protein n=1 Tax=Streptomyces sp. NPDC059917 TaxID=3347002 RepID=UPI0036508953